MRSLSLAGRERPHPRAPSTATPSITPTPGGPTGSLFAWGGNTWGQLGEGNTRNRLVPTANGFAGATGLAAGGGHTVALRGDGTVWTWGRNDFGQLGIVTSTMCQGAPCSLVPMQVSGLSGVQAVTALSLSSAVLRNDGTVWIWGLGHGATPIQVPGITDVAAISARFTTLLLLKRDGTVWDFPLGSTDPPLPVVGLVNITGVAAGQDHNLALRQDGTVWAWGVNSLGQMGTGTASSAVPVQVSGLSGVVAIAAGENHSVAVRNNGTVWAWGWNFHGQLGAASPTCSLGFGQFTPCSLVPIQAAGLTDIVRIVAGDRHNLAVRSDGSLWAWGANGSGQLGDGLTSNRSPFQVPHLTQVGAIGAGNDHSLAMAISTAPPPTLTPTPHPSVPNDHFANAAPLAAPGSATGNTQSASLEGDEPRPCGSINRTVWYRLIPSSNGELTATASQASGSSIDPVLALYTGTELWNLQLLQCVDDPAFTTTQLTTNVRAGETYYLQLGGGFLSSGAFNLDVSLLAGPANDDFATATLLALPATVTGNNSLATSEPAEPSSCVIPNKSVWFRVQPSTSGILVANAAGSAFETNLALYTGSSLNNLVNVACDFDFNDDVTSLVRGSVAAGETYYLALSGAFNGMQGPFTLSVSLESAPANDNFAAATVLPLPGSASGDTFQASTEAGENATLDTDLSLWYRIEPPSSGTLVLTLEGPRQNSFRLWRGTTFANLDFVASGEHTDQRIEADVQAGGDPYFVRVGGSRFFFQNVRGGPFTLHASLVLPPPNDNFASAAPLLLPATVAGTTLAATIEPTEPIASCQGGIDTSVWYRIQPVASGQLTLQTPVNDPFVPSLFLYSGSSLSTLQLLTHVCGLNPLIVSVEAGQTYYAPGGRLLWP